MPREKDKLLLQAIFPLTFTLWSFISIPYLSLLPSYVVFNEAPPTIIGSTRREYRIILGVDELQNVVGLDINIFFLICLVLLIAFQMIIPWHPHPVYDLGANLLISAIVVLVWYQYLISIVASIPMWEPIIFSTIPMLGMVMVPVNRIFILYVVERVL